MNTEVPGSVVKILDIYNLHVFWCMEVMLPILLKFQSNYNIVTIRQSQCNKKN